jgi:hypothetical protein
MPDQRGPTFDPLSSWREWMSQRETQLNSLFNDLMSTEGYSRVMGVVTKALVSMQKSTSEGMERYFTALSLPTRSDVIDLGERLATIESRLLAIETSLHKIAGTTATENSSLTPSIRPPRTKKPASAKGGAR